MIITNRKSALVQWLGYDALTVKTRVQFPDAELVFFFLIFDFSFFFLYNKKRQLYVLLLQILSNIAAAASRLLLIFVVFFSFFFEGGGGEGSKIKKIMMQKARFKRSKTYIRSVKIKRNNDI